MQEDMLDKQIEEITAKMRERDEKAAKEAEKELRQAMRKDTAGTVLGIFNTMHAQLMTMQAMLDATNPLVALLRSLNVLTARVNEIDARLAAVEKG